jgi:outer membrane receptor for ferrienterochelin and colicin
VKRRQLLPSICGLLSLSVSARAQSDGLDALLGQSIVSTPSKGSETDTTAPATSTVITAEQLRRYGLRSLDEAINYLSLGMATSSSLHAAEVGARGVLINGDYGNHVLLLLDGHVLNEPWNGTAYFERGAGVPFELIDHIEIMLGPGSVLYGSQAMLGVIHIVTKGCAWWPKRTPRCRRVRMDRCAARRARVSLAISPAAIEWAQVMAANLSLAAELPS